eukprot:TRINITY_DN3793_c0_g2_i7.p2 TRINITY_DN3793_c0_g2~~TRINITY_DN3793_c0_g2_i7.p2  ORF type:complete len:161 (-),score=32.24 TRINITY_DN3793_c0_g2_i7:971-1453(-)
MLLQSCHVIARAYCLLFWIGDYENTEEAYRLLSTECDASDPHVQYLLGRCYHGGYGCTRDEAQAALYFERAGNHIEAVNYLADMFSPEDGPIADRQRAIALLRQAATQGYVIAQYQLGYWYERDLPGVLEKDIAQAKHWYSLSAAQRYLRAAHALGRLNS